MQEGFIMENVKGYVGFILFMLIFSVVIFFIQVGDFNTFKQQVNYQIERQGGLTESALEEINDFSKNNYNGRFTVESELLNEKVDYGEAVDYEVIGTFKFNVFDLPEVNIPSNGTGVSQVR